MQLPVLKAIAEEFGWQDLRLFDEMTQGFQLLGPINPGVGWRLRSDARYSAPKNLDDFFVENHDLVQNKLRSAKVEPCWEVMAEEIAADVLLGRMEGPFAAPDSWSKQTVPLPSHAHTACLKPPPTGQLACSFAFAVHQVGSDGREKVRRAEDWRQSGANSTVSVPDTPAYHGVDAFVHVARALSAECAPGDLRVWGLDHEAVYRQLPVANPDHTFVILNTPSGPTLWRHNVLMFGSTASVRGYCRVADLMSWLDRCLLLIPMLHFVDDFGGVDSSNLAQSAFECSQRVCGALGLKFKLSKAQPPTRAHKLQGVYLQLGETEATVAMTPERAQRLDNQLKQVILDNKLSPKEASSLAGKLQFVTQSLFGRASAAALRPLYRRAHSAHFRSSKGGWQLSESIMAALDFLRRRLRESKPRVVRYVVEERAIIYADAFFEIGGRRYRPAEAEEIPCWGRTAPASFINGWGFVACVSGKTVFAAGSVPFWFVRHFSSRRAYIFMLEVVAQLVPLLVLREELPSHQLLFVDNEPARHALTKGFTNDANMNKLLQVAWNVFEKMAWWPEWQRVNSSANVSNGVSRRDFSAAYANGWAWKDHNYDDLFERLLSAVTEFPLGTGL